MQDLLALFKDNQGNIYLCSEKATGVPKKPGRETSQR